MQCHTCVVAVVSVLVMSLTSKTAVTPSHKHDPVKNVIIIVTTYKYSIWHPSNASTSIVWIRLCDASLYDIVRLQMMLMYIILHIRDFAKHHLKFILYNMH